MAKNKKTVKKKKKSDAKRNQKVEFFKTLLGMTVLVAVVFLAGFIAHNLIPKNLTAAHIPEKNIYNRPLYEICPQEKPKAVYIDPYFLTTLPAREFGAGVAEVVKMAVTFDKDFFTFLERNNESDIIIKESGKNHIPLPNAVDIYSLKLSPIGPAVPLMLKIVIIAKHPYPIA